MKRTIWTPFPMTSCDFCSTMLLCAKYSKILCPPALHISYFARTFTGGTWLDPLASQFRLWAECLTPREDLHKLNEKWRLVETTTEKGEVQREAFPCVRRKHLCAAQSSWNSVPFFCGTSPQLNFQRGTVLTCTLAGYYVTAGSPIYNSFPWHSLHMGVFTFFIHMPNLQISS